LHSLLGVKKVVIRLECANSRTEEGIPVNTHQVGFMNAQLVLFTVDSSGSSSPFADFDHETARSACPPQSQNACHTDLEESLFEKVRENEPQA
jgi:hypothetical protein